MLVLHGSDLQIGRPFRPDPAEAFRALAETSGPDVIVVSGDLTQRAKAGEYRRVRAFLESLPAIPVVVTPGNHDVPLYRVWERLLQPYRNWRRYVAPELDSVTRVDGATVVALNSSAPRRAIVGGRIDGRQIRFAREAFAESPGDDIRVLVTHHHFVATPDRQGGRPLPRGRTLLDAFEDMGVDVILGGHVHQAHFYTSRALVEGSGPGIPILACGTTASSRGRGVEKDRNSLDLVRVTLDSVEVQPHLFDTQTGRFVAGSAKRFPRPRLAEPAGRGEAP